MQVFKYSKVYRILRVSENKKKKFREQTKIHLKTDFSIWSLWLGGSLRTINFLLVSRWIAHSCVIQVIWIHIFNFCQTIVLDQRKCFCEWGTNTIGLGLIHSKGSTYIFSCKPPLLFVFRNFVHTALVAFLANSL